MPTYDPRRSRPTPKVAPDEESAPIDALLGPDPDPEPSSTSGGEATSPPPEEALPAPVRRVERAPSALLQMAPVVLAVLIVVLVWLARRRRR